MTATGEHETNLEPRSHDMWFRAYRFSIAAAAAASTLTENYMYSHKPEDRIFRLLALYSIGATTLFVATQQPSAVMWYYQCYRTTGLGIRIRG